jgi:lipoyl-dependent peroxiredoxin
MLMARTATAEWKGNLQEGEGTMALGSGSFTGSYTYKSRFEDGPGTNPEELIAAAEAGCFTMQLASTLAQAGHTVESVASEARVQIRNIGGTPTIAQISLTTRARVPGLDDAELQETALDAQNNCIISRSLAGVGEITVEATLEN